LIESIAINPRKILGLTVPKIAVGEKANLTVFNSELNWTFETKKMKSKSRNSPFDQFKFKGKAIAVINNGICRIVD
jgi:dihydroorotase